MKFPKQCKGEGCTKTIYFEIINGKSRPFEDESCTVPHICPGFKRARWNEEECFTYENLLRGIIINLEIIKEDLRLIKERTWIDKFKS